MGDITRHCIKKKVKVNIIIKMTKNRKLNKINEKPAY